MIMRLLDQYYEENRANPRGSFMILFSIFSVGGLVMFCNVLYEMINTHFYCQVSRHSLSWIRKSTFCLKGYLKKIMTSTFFISPLDNRNVNV